MGDRTLRPNKLAFQIQKRSPGAKCPFIHPNPRSTDWLPPGPTHVLLIEPHRFGCMVYYMRLKRLLVSCVIAGITVLGAAGGNASQIRSKGPLSFLDRYHPWRVRADPRSYFLIFPRRSPDIRALLLRELPRRGWDVSAPRFGSLSAGLGSPPRFAILDLGTNPEVVIRGKPLRKSAGETCLWVSTSPAKRTPSPSERNMRGYTTTHKVALYKPVPFKQALVFSCPDQVGLDRASKALKGLDVSIVALHGMISIDVDKGQLKAARQRLRAAGLDDPTKRWQIH